MENATGKYPGAFESIDLTNALLSTRKFRTGDPGGRPDAWKSPVKTLPHKERRHRQKAATVSLSAKRGREREREGGREEENRHANDFIPDTRRFLASLGKPGIRKLKNRGAGGEPMPRNMRGGCWQFREGKCTSAVMVVLSRSKTSFVVAWGGPRSSLSLSLLWGAAERAMRTILAESPVPRLRP